MAPADRNPSSRASPIPASDSATSKDEGFERTTIGPMPKSESTPAVSDEMTRRVDLSANRGYADDWYPAAKEKRERVAAREPEQKARDAEQKPRDVDPRGRAAEPKPRDLEQKKREGEPKTRDVESKKREVESRARDVEPRTRDVESRPRDAEQRSSRPKDPRRTEVYKDKPDVVGAPERTMVAPLPRRHEEVEPIPDAASTNGARYTAEADARKQRRAEAEMLRRNVASRREARRRDGGLSARDKIVEQRTDKSEREAPVERDAHGEPIEKTNPGIDPAELSPSRKDRSERPSRDERPGRDERHRDERRADDRRPDSRESLLSDERSDARRFDRDDGLRPAARDQRPAERKPDQALVHQNTSIEKAKSDGPWSRLGVAIKDVSRAVATSTKEVWHILRTEGPKPLWLKAKPTLVRGWVATRDFVMRIRNKAVYKAVELGWIKPKPQTEYEQHGDDRLDQGRVDAWRKFHKGKTSSSYLQDDE